MARLPTAGWFHPVRYRRTRPFADQAVSRWVKAAGTQSIRVEVLNELLETIIEAHNERIMGVPRQERPRSTTAALNNELNALAVVGAFTAAGRNVFMPTPSLLAMLDSTDLGSVRLGDIQLPYDAFYVAFGDAFDEGLPGAGSRVDGAYVHRVRKSGVVAVVLTCRILGEDERWPWVIEPTYHVTLADDAEATLEELIGRSIEDGELRLDPEHIPDYSALAEAAVGGAVHIQFRGQRTERERAAFMQQGLPTFRRALGLVANTLCYMHAVDDRAPVRYPGDAPASLVQAAFLEGQKKSVERERARRRLLDDGYVAVRVLGRSLDVEADGAPPQQTGREVRPHWRRGHWRRQPYGEQRQQVKLLWIRPTIVRSDRGQPEDGHLYVVSEQAEPREN